MKMIMKRTDKTLWQTFLSMEFDVKCVSIGVISILLFVFILLGSIVIACFNTSIISGLLMLMLFIGVLGFVVGLMSGFVKDVLLDYDYYVSEWVED